LQKLFESHIKFSNLLIEYLNTNFIQAECKRSSESLFSEYAETSHQQATCFKSSTKSQLTASKDDLLIQFFDKYDVLFVDKHLYENYGRSLLESDQSYNPQDLIFLIDQKVF
jgi:hypothetical protein